MAWFLRIAGIALVALGALWIVQGLGLVEIDPILCVADCTALSGPSPGWALAGAVAAALGALLLLRGERRG